MAVKNIVWDVDRVWYPGISTSYCAEGREGSPRERLNEYMREGLFSANDMLLWASVYGKGADPMESYGNAAAMLTDFLYRMRVKGEPVFTKDKTIKAKQGLLAGTSLAEVREIADSVRELYTAGLLEALGEFKKKDLAQTALSDGLGPFILYHCVWNCIDNPGVVPAVVNVEGEEHVLREIDDVLLTRKRDSTFLTGRTMAYSKSADLQSRFGHDLGTVAIIDDSGANVESMLVPVRDAGGIAVGFRPTDAHRAVFAEHGIPILKGQDLRAFMEVAMDPSKLREYAE